MRIRYWFCLLLGLMWAGVATAADLLVDFEDLPLQPQQAVAADGQSGAFRSRGVGFNQIWDTDWNCCPRGWVYSNQTDLKTVGYTNPFSAQARVPEGGGYQSSQYAVAVNIYRGDARIEFPEWAVLQGFYVTNTTYVYHSVVSGDDGAGFVKGPFGAGDWLKLEVIGLDEADQEVGRLPVYLADYREGSRVLDDWTWVDLSALGSNVKRIEFDMASTDSGDFGMNTPAYFAIDNLVYRTATGALPGDLDGDGLLGLSDVNRLSRGIHESSQDLALDLNGDRRVDGRDLTVWVKGLKKTSFGDAGLDGVFGSADLVQVFQVGAYEQAFDTDWAGGDWNADLRFNTSDLLEAFQDGGFQASAAAVVPEPTSSIPAVLVLGWLTRYARIRRGARSAGL